MDAFDEDAEPFDLKDDRDLEAADDSEEEFFDDDLEDAGEDDIDLVVAVYREDGKATAVPMDFDLANDLDELIRQLGRLPGDSGADGYVSVAGEFFVICRVRGRVVEVLLSDATAANDWPIARDSWTTWVRKSPTRRTNRPDRGPGDVRRRRVAGFRTGGHRHRLRGGLRRAADAGGAAPEDRRGVRTGRRGL